METFIYKLAAIYLQKSCIMRKEKWKLKQFIFIKRKMQHLLKELQVPCLDDGCQWLEMMAHGWRWRLQEHPCWCRNRKSKPLGVIRWRYPPLGRLAIRNGRQRRFSSHWMRWRLESMCPQTSKHYTKENTWSNNQFEPKSIASATSIKKIAINRR